MNDTAQTEKNALKNLYIRECYTTTHRRTAAVATLPSLQDSIATDCISHNSRWLIEETAVQVSVVEPRLQLIPAALTPHGGGIGAKGGRHNAPRITIRTVTCFCKNEVTEQEEEEENKVEEGK